MKTLVEIATKAGFERQRKYAIRLLRLSIRRNPVVPTEEFGIPEYTKFKMDVYKSSIDANDKKELVSGFMKDLKDLLFNYKQIQGVS